MGTFQVEIEIGDPQGGRWEKVQGTVGTHATFALAPSSLLQRLGVQPERRISLRHPDGQLVERDAAQTWLRICEKSRIGIVVFGDEDESVLVGTNTLQGMLLEPDYEKETLVSVVGLMPSRRIA